jgi:hypothetical protein
LESVPLLDHTLQKLGLSLYRDSWILPTSYVPSLPPKIKISLRHKIAHTPISYEELEIAATAQNKYHIYGKQNGEWPFQHNFDVMVQKS